MLSGIPPLCFLRRFAARFFDLSLPGGVLHRFRFAFRNALYRANALQKTLAFMLPLR